MPTTYDLSIYGAVHGLAAASLAPLETWVAQWVIFAVPIVLIGLWIRNDVSDRKAGIRACISAAIALAVSGIVSFFVFEPRPFMIGLAGNVLDHASDSSFPSDHVAIMAAVTATLALCEKVRLSALTTAATLLVAWSRVAIGIHFPIDILTGAGVGILAGAAVTVPSVDPFVEFVQRLAQAVSAALWIDRLSAALRRALVDKP